jgi:hypothetical protein
MLKELLKRVKILLGLLFIKNVFKDKILKINKRKMQENETI